MKIKILLSAREPHSTRGLLIYMSFTAVAHFAGNDILVALLPNKNQWWLILDIDVNEVIQTNINRLNQP